MPTTCSVSERQSTDPDTGARKPTPNNSPFDELIAAAAALVMRCCSGDAEGLLSCNFCQRVSELGRPILHGETCPVGRVQRAGVKAMVPADGCGLIAIERLRQIQAEGWTPEHDDSHQMGELASASMCYASTAIDPELHDLGTSPNDIRDEWWPFGDEWWNPCADPIRNLVKAGALIAAEIDRLQRAAAVKFTAPAGRSMAHGAPELPVRRALSLETAAKIPEVRRAATIAAGHHRGPCSSFRELVTPDFVLELLGLVPDGQQAGRVPEDDLASPVESDESWQASERLTAIELQARETGQVGGSNAFPPLGAVVVPPQGEAAPARVEPDPDRERRRVVCGHVIAIYGLAGRTTLLCDLDPDHGDAFHTDRSAQLSWGSDVYEIHVQASGVMEYRQLGAEPFFVHPPAVDGLRPDAHLGAVEAEAVAR